MYIILIIDISHNALNIALALFLKIIVIIIIIKL